MLNYSVKARVSYAQEKKKIAYPVDFAYFTSLATYFFVHAAQLITHPMHWDISENLLTFCLPWGPMDPKMKFDPLLLRTESKHDFHVTWLFLSLVDLQRGRVSQI